MDEVDDFPYRAEYAKSSRASCRSCKGNIEKGSLRLAAMVQSPAFDGKIPQWYHYMCFFSKQRPKAAQDIAHFDSLRWEDQQKIKEKIEKSANVPLSSGKKKSAGSKNSDKNYSIEYAKSGRAACKGCEEKILKDVIRVSALDFESDKAKQFGPIPRWHHVDCFVGLRKELQYFNSGTDLNGFNTLSSDDKKMIREKIKAIKSSTDVTDSMECSVSKSSSVKEDVSKKQNDKMFQFRDLLEKNLNKNEMIMLLEHNNYDPLTGESRLLDTLADLMTFGNIGRCETCISGNLIYRSGVGYVCNGSISEWTKCSIVVDAPKRSPFEVPAELKEEYPFLKKYKYKKFGDRALVKRTVSESHGVKRKMIEKLKPLEDYTFVIVGEKFAKSKKEIKEKILSLGGEVSSKIESTTAAVITTKDVVDAISKKILPAKEHGVECVPEEFLDEIEPEGVMLMIRKKNMASWAKDVEQRLAKLKKLKSSYKSKSSADSKYELNQDKMKITLKGGGHIDSKSGLADSCHVYKASGKLYSVILGMVDLARKINSYYKLQVLESDDKRSWYLYRSWGRIGTTIGDHRVEDKEDLQDALRDFNDLYEKKTGNKFSSKNQQKLSGYWYPLDIDHGEKSSAKLQKLNVKKSKSKLAVQIQELVALLFDVKSMESTMVEYELDLKKMPLGKLSQKQIENAYKVLSEAMEWIEKLKGDCDEKPGKSTQTETDAAVINNHLLDCSNRFYTLIPHDFGMKNPPLLNNEDYIKNKIDMVDSLKEIEIAYNLLKTEGGDDSSDPIDTCYKKLKTEMEVVDKSSTEFDMVKTYIKNTHGSTHSHYTLELDEVFKVKRQGEEKRYKPFKKLHNRQLLWHGSRLTNFAGILSQGLRIAPPEAPATGYMFGKGIYFADMVSKSANYCCTSAANPTGLLLLCDVALGDMYELKGAKYITKLPSGKHSTKGMGRTHPDPENTIKLEDGLQVPLGTSKDADVKNPTLLYNEYIVYDTAQVNMKYLLKTSFKYKY